MMHNTYDFIKADRFPTIAEWKFLHVVQWDSDGSLQVDIDTSSRGQNASAYRVKMLLFKAEDLQNELGQRQLDTVLVDEVCQVIDITGICGNYYFGFTPSLTEPLALSNSHFAIARVNDRAQITSLDIYIRNDPSTVTVDGFSRLTKEKKSLDSKMRCHAAGVSGRGFVVSKRTSAATNAIVRSLLDRIHRHTS